MWLRRAIYRRLLADLAEARASVWQWHAWCADIRIDNELLRAEVERLKGET
jgi:hypothetical protein